MVRLLMVLFVLSGAMGKIYTGDPPPEPPAPAAAPVHPAQRMWGSLLYDPATSHILLFGGLGSNDTWMLNLANRSWSRIEAINIPAVTRISGVIATYERRAKRMIVFNYLGTGVAGETWSYDPQTATWQNLKPVNSPMGTRFTSLVYDSKVDKIFLFGGEDDYFIRNNDLWSYDYQTNIWTQQNPKNSPPPTSLAHIVYDPSVDRVMMWGGSPIRSSREIWWYNYAIDTWTKTIYSDGPRPDADGSMTFSPIGNQIFLYVGEQFWSYNAAKQRWAQLPTNGGPGRQYGTSLVFDELNRKLVLFGGAGGNEDTWLFNPDTQKWSVMAVD